MHRKILSVLIVTALAGLIGGAPKAWAVDWQFEDTGVPVSVEADPPTCKTDYDCRYFPGTQCNTGTGLCFVPSSASKCACGSDGDPCTEDGGTVTPSGFCHCPRTRLTTPECTKKDGGEPGVIVKEPPLDPVTGTPDPVKPKDPADPEVPEPVVSPEPVTNIPDEEPVVEPVPEDTPAPTPEDSTPIEEAEPSPPLSDGDCLDGVVVLGDCRPKDFLHIQGGGEGCALIQGNAPAGISLHGWLLVMAAVLLGALRGARLKAFALTAAVAALFGCSYEMDLMVIDRTKSETAAPQQGPEAKAEEAVSSMRETLPPASSVPAGTSAPAGTPAHENPNSDQEKEKGKDLEWTIVGFSGETTLPLPERPLEIVDYKTEITVPFEPREEETPEYSFTPVEFIQVEHVDREEIKES